MAFQHADGRRGRGRALARALAAGGASVGLHAAILVALAAAGIVRAPQPQPRVVALAAVAPAAWEANRAVAAETAERAVQREVAPRPAETVAEEQRPKGTAVEVAPVPDRRPPREARFVADHDGTVEHETVSKLAGRYERLLAVPSEGSSQAPPPPLPAPPAGEGRAEGAARPIVDRPLSPPSPPVVPSPPSRPIVAGGEGEPRKRAETERASVVPSLPLAPPPGGAEGAGGGGAGAKDGGRLRLPLGALERIAGGPAPVLATGVDEGPGTFLGTRRYRYASFFNRIQESVVAHWDPDHAYDAHDPRRSLYPYRVRVTTLWFTLDAEGRLKQLKILKRSGLDFLDEAAVRAVREASPFPNPPAALVRDGEIEFGTFSFDHGPGGVRDALTPKVPGP